MCRHLLIDCSRSWSLSASLAVSSCSPSTLAAASSAIASMAISSVSDTSPSVTMLSISSDAAGIATPSCAAPTLMPA